MTNHDKAVAIAEKISSFLYHEEISPETVERIASEEEIGFFFEKMCI